ncbi:hypothetical protein EAY29_20740, partial [Vibrio anguillarum]|uniref:hypothetical protein n=1 Tax=Vibrio anguillarum TaxID=55601 RepID=UPI001BE4815A
SLFRPTINFRGVFGCLFFDQRLGPFYFKQRKITSLIVGGFKGIKNKATIPLAPITLVAIQ